jgi:putative hydrolase of the HAD superfamily
VLNNHNLNPKKTLFIDDKKENTDVAEQLGLIVWNLEVGKEDVVDLFSKKFNF